jgi:muramoyltetrapeptide carboxypeptidase
MAQRPFDPNLTLPMGALVRLDAGKKELMLEQDVVTR